MLNERKRRELLGMSLLALSVFTLLSLLPVSVLPRGEQLFATGNVMGVLGRWFAEAGYRVLGVGALTIPLAFAVAGSACFDWLRRESAMQWVALLSGLAVLVPAIAALFSAGAGVEIVALLAAETA